MSREAVTLIISVTPSLAYLAKQRRQHMAILVTKLSAVATDNSIPPSESLTIAMQLFPFGSGTADAVEPSTTSFREYPARKKFVQASELSVDEYTTLFSPEKLSTQARSVRELTIISRL